MKRAPIIAHASVVALLAVLGFASGRHAFGAVPLQPFYQNEFGPAVMVALGRGFVQPTPAPGGALEAFLAPRTSSLAEAEVDAVATARLNQFQFAHRYLLTAVGLWWRVTEISWAQVAGVAGLAYALMVVAMFALLRLLVPMVPSAVGAIWLAASPLPLAYAAHVRDFSKGAFVLAVIPFVIALTLRPMTLRALAATAAAAGAVVGIGLGFKMDVVVMAPITLACVLLFRGSRPWTALHEKAVIFAAMAAGVVVTAAPILAPLSSGGSNSVHVVLLGYSDWFDTRLGIQRGPYSFTPFYSDTYMMNVIQARAWDVGASSPGVPSPEYDAAALELWRQWLRHFPADIYTRLLAAVDGILNLAFNASPPAIIESWRPAAWLTPVNDWLYRWTGWGAAVGAAAVFVASRQGARPALFAATVLVLLAGYPSLQFDLRHYFHLQAIPIALLVVLACAAVSFVFRRRRREPVPPHMPIVRRFALVAAVVLGIALPAAVLRSYQGAHLRHLVGEMVGFEREAIEVEFVPEASGRFLARWNAPGEPAGNVGFRRAYYIAEFKTDEPQQLMAIGLRYTAPNEQSCTVTRRLQSGAGVTRFMFPAYARDGAGSLDGIEVGAEMRRRFTGLYRLSNRPQVLPVEWRLASNWQERRLFERLVKEERLSADDVGATVVNADQRCGADINLIDAVMSGNLAPDRLEVGTLHSGDVRVEAGGITLDGRANDEPALLVDFAPRVMSTGDQLVARLWLQHGNVMMALVRDGQWVRNVLAVTPGASVLVLQVPEPGEYGIQLLSGNPGMRATLAFTIDRLGIVPAPATP